MSDISYILLMIGLVILGIVIASYFYKKVVKKETNNDNKATQWLFYIIFFATFAIFIHFIDKPPETKKTSQSKMTPPSQPLQLSQQESNEDAQEFEEAEDFKETTHSDPAEKPSPTIERPVAFKGYRNLTQNNLDYDLLDPTDITTGYEKLVGYTQVKAKLESLLKILANYSSNLNKNTTIPHGLLLHGQGSEDLTKLALAIGKHWGQKVIVVNGPDFGVDGKGRSQIRELYADSITLAPLVVIIKEIEFLLPVDSHTNIDYQESMQRFYKWFDDLNENNQPVLIVGLTDNLYKIDPAAFKLGRFDYQIQVEEPNETERSELLKMLFNDFNIKAGDIKNILKQTEGFSRSDLYHFINQSMLKANLNNSRVSEKDLTFALQYTIEAKENYDRYKKTSSLNKDFQLITPDEITNRFSDLAGLQDVKEELKDALDGLREPEKYARIGAIPPRGFLLYGPPGTGKTMMARALAGESQVNFINVSGSEFIEEWVGTGAMRIRNLFNLARQNAPCIIFIDEFDALAVKRQSDTGGGGNNERNQTINQLLVEMDNLDKSRNANVFIMAATNNISALDKAVLRPGRFDRKILFRLPNDEERKLLITQILHTKKIKIDFDVATLISNTKGYSPAELNNLINQAILYAAKKGKTSISEEDINAVRNKVSEEMLSLTKQDIDLDIEIFRPNQLNSNFKSLAGLDDVKKELSQMISFLKNPEKAQAAGINIPRGWIFHGPPGTGKTSLARAVAGESGVTFISTSGSAFVQQWVGLGATRVRELFEVARQYSPAIIFIDEIDAVASKRSNNSGGDEYAQTTNQLLVELDNVNKERNANIVVIGATNRLDKLDEAMTRPGRLGKSVYIRLPNLAEREHIFNMYLAKIKPASDVEAKKLASTTGGFSGADIENLVSEAAMIAYENNKAKVTMNDFENAKDIILLGRETKANVLPDEQKNTAYHEAGHAIVGIFSKNYPLKFYKVTIGVRDETLGVTFFEEHLERYGYTKEAYLDIIATKLAGKIAEEMIFGKNYVTSGPSNDLKQATELAQDMVKKYGMGRDDSYIAYEYLDSPSREIVNQQIEDIIKECAARAQKILTDNRTRLDALAKALLEKETLSHDEVMKIIR
ncbi:AAA family ATPase [Candidatus Berkiella aquae]|uniref:AAA family ATPase n=1 Tax=Candidatus Berkiella aquae TaxID=295108 RepID=A0A0Q9YIJ0_9GAMM|nr:AAA family ATPase [Candidatus Berkiella aquae]MCS5712200.1 AAA family ATPase [Candidatus Berkiella aquae]